MQIRGGDLLIAPAAMRDTRFHKSVILITHHHSEGSYGLCLNRPSGHTVQDVIDEANLDLDCQLQMPLYWGGPVHPGTVWMIHDPNWTTEHTIAVNEHWSITSHTEMFHHLADQDLPKYFRIFHGYTGWGPGQLQMEMDSQGPWAKHSSWLTVSQIEPDLVLEQDESQLWTATVELSARQAIDLWL
jgi:putative transcriptional regulator